MKKALFLIAFIAVNTIIFAQTSAGNVGINTKDPSATLDIVSKGIDATTKALEINNSSATPEMLTLLNNGNMGLGIANPADHLHLKYGSIRIDDDDNSDNGIKFSATGGIYHRLGSSLGVSGAGKYISMNSNSFGVALETSNSDPAKNGLLMLRTGTGNIGINEPDPTAKLHVKASDGVATGFRLQDGSEANGKLLTSDANGFASWQNYKAQYYNASCNVTSNLPLEYSVQTALPGIDGFTAQKSGKYLIFLHPFFKTTETDQKNFYFVIYKNGLQWVNLESYVYVKDGSYINIHVPYTATLSANDVITFKIINMTVGASTVYIDAPTASRNSIEAVYIGE